MASDFHRQASRKVDNTGLGDVGCNLAGAWPQCRYGTQINDATLPARLHVWEYGARIAYRCHQVQLDARCPVLVTDLLERAAQAGARIVDENVHLPGALYHRVRDGACAIPIRSIAIEFQNEKRGVRQAQFFLEAIQIFPAAADQREGGALPREGERRRPADTPAGAYDHHDFSFESQIHYMLLRGPVTNSAPKYRAPVRAASGIP